MWKPALLLISLSLGCAPKIYEIEMCQIPSAVRCGKSQHVEMCGPHGHWFVAMKCRDLGPEWTCDDNRREAGCTKPL